VVVTNTGSLEQEKQMNKNDKMPDHIKVLDKILSFKGQLRSFLLQHAIYSVEQYRDLISP